jgi:hypothetical protein
MTKVFISQGMKGKTEAEITAKREQYVAEIAKMFRDGYEIIDSYRPEWAEELKEGSNKRIFFLGKSLQLLSEADYVFFEEDWFNFDGCCVEHMVCERYGIKRNTL